MRPYSLSHLSDGRLVHDLKSLVARDRTVTAALLAHIAEVDARKLYLPAAFPSMFAYCVHELGLSEDAAYRRITAARLARQFPAIFEAIAEGRVNLTSVGLLAPHLTPEDVDDLLNAATGKTRAEVELLLAQRFPRSEELPLVTSLPGYCKDSSCQLVPERVGMTDPELSRSQGQSDLPCASVAPIAPERFALHLTIGKDTYDKLRRAQELMSHQVEAGDVAEVLDRALDLLVAQLEKRKFAAVTRPSSSHRPTARPRHIPAHVKRAVWLRDGGRCTFVSESGHRCPARDQVEFDHIDPVARGGTSTTANLRLRCRAHNQFAAECEFGAEFMEGRRQEAQETREARARDEARKRAEEVIPYLRRLGFRAAEAREAAAQCEAIPDAPLEERVRRALRWFHPRGGALAHEGRSA